MEEEEQSVELDSARRVLGSGEEDTDRLVDSAEDADRAKCSQRRESSNAVSSTQSVVIGTINVEQSEQRSFLVNAREEPLSNCVVDSASVGLSASTGEHAAIDEEARSADLCSTTADDSLSARSRPGVTFDDASLHESAPTVLRDEVERLSAAAAVESESPLSPVEECDEIACSDAAHQSLSCILSSIDSAQFSSPAAAQPSLDVTVSEPPGESSQSFAHEASNFQVLMPSSPVDGIQSSSESADDLKPSENEAAIRSSSPIVSSYSAQQEETTCDNASANLTVATPSSPPAAARSTQGVRSSGILESADSLPRSLDSNSREDTNETSAAAIRPITSTPSALLESSAPTDLQHSPNNLTSSAICDQTNEPSPSVDPSTRAAEQTDVCISYSTASTELHASDQEQHESGPESPVHAVVSDCRSPPLTGTSTASVTVAEQKARSLRLESLLPLAAANEIESSRRSPSSAALSPTPQRTTSLSSEEKCSTTHALLPRARVSCAKLPIQARSRWLLPSSMRSIAPTTSGKAVQHQGAEEKPIASTPPRTSTPETSTVAALPALAPDDMSRRPEEFSVKPEATKLNKLAVAEQRASVDENAPNSQMTCTPERASRPMLTACELPHLIKSSANRSSEERPDGSPASNASESSKSCSATTQAAGGYVNVGKPDGSSSIRLYMPPGAKALSLVNAGGPGKSLGDTTTTIVTPVNAKAAELQRSNDEPNKENDDNVTTTDDPSSPEALISCNASPTSVSSAPASAPDTAYYGSLAFSESASTAAESTSTPTGAPFKLKRPSTNANKSSKLPNKQRKSTAAVTELPRSAEAPPSLSSFSRSGSVELPARKKKLDDRTEAMLRTALQNGILVVHQKAGIRTQKHGDSNTASSERTQVNAKSPTMFRKLSAPLGVNKAKGNGQLGRLPIKLDPSKSSTRITTVKSIQKIVKERTKSGAPGERPSTASPSTSSTSVSPMSSTSTTSTGSTPKPRMPSGALRTSVSVSSKCNWRPALSSPKRPHMKSEASARQAGPKTVAMAAASSQPPDKSTIIVLAKTTTSNGTNSTSSMTAQVTATKQTCAPVESTVSSASELPVQNRDLPAKLSPTRPNEDDDDEPPEKSPNCVVSNTAVEPPPAVIEAPLPAAQPKKRVRKRKPRPRAKPMLPSPAPPPIAAESTNDSACASDTHGIETLLGAALSYEETGGAAADFDRWRREMLDNLLKFHLLQPGGRICWARVRGRALPVLRQFDFNAPQAELERRDVIFDELSSSLADRREELYQRFSETRLQQELKHRTGGPAHERYMLARMQLKQAHELLENDRR